MKAILRAVRLKCLDCSGGSEKEVRECVIPSCALYPFRMGKSGRTKPLTPEQRDRFVERMRRAREQRQVGTPS